jgi:hypothetical protein
VRTAVVRYDGKVILREPFPLPEKLTRHSIMCTLASSLQRTREMAALNAINPLAAGRSVPGFINYDDAIWPAGEEMCLKAIRLDAKNIFELGAAWYVFKRLDGRTI